MANQQKSFDFIESKTSKKNLAKDPTVSFDGSGHPLSRNQNRFPGLPVSLADPVSSKNSGVVAGLDGEIAQWVSHKALVSAKFSQEPLTRTENLAARDQKVALKTLPDKSSSFLRCASALSPLESKASQSSDSGEVRPENETWRGGSQDLICNQSQEGKPTERLKEQEMGTVDRSISPPHPDRQALLNQLRQKTGCVQHVKRTQAVESFSTGITGLDHWLPMGGLRFDGITEWINERRGTGAVTLALMAAENRLRNSQWGNGPLVVISDASHFYPPAAIALGIPPKRILWVRPSNRKDQVWAIDQTLRCQSVSAVLVTDCKMIDDRDARRFQLASEQGKTSGFFIRPDTDRRQACFAEVRFHVRGTPRTRDIPPDSEKITNLISSNLSSHLSELDACSSQRLPRQFEITLDRCRGGRVGRQGVVEMNDQGDVSIKETGSKGFGKDEKTLVYLVSELANPTNSKRQSNRAGQSNRASRAV